MPGQARVLTKEQQEHLFNEIKKHRYALKNNLIMLLSFDLGLRVSEITKLKIKEVGLMNKENSIDVFDIMTLPASYTKGAGSSSIKTVRFSVDEFDQIVKKIVLKTKNGEKVNSTDFHKTNKKRKGKSRDLPLGSSLKIAIKRYIEERLLKNEIISPSSPLILSQKGGAYTANGLQEHMAHILRKWANIEKGKSHSGRRTLMTEIVIDKKLPISVAQKIAGHKSAATTAIYAEPSEIDLKIALDKDGKNR